MSDNEQRDAEPASSEPSDEARALDDWCEAKRIAEIAASYFDAADDEEFITNFGRDVQNVIDAAILEHEHELRKTADRLALENVGLAARLATARREEREELDKAHAAQLRTARKVFSDDDDGTLGEVIDYLAQLQAAAIRVREDSER